MQTSQPLAAPTVIYLADYTPPSYLIDTVELTFRLAPKATRVLSRIAFRPNPAATSRDFFLHGELLKLISAKIDGTPVEPRLVVGGLECDVPDAPFIWEAEVEISPAENFALEGLYMSNGMYCTQCEAEGFRKITFYPDRPDVMATFKVRLESDLPVLLSNGNPLAQGEGFAEWHDPWPKPAYLFALVAGELQAKSGQFTTKSGRDVDLNVWVRAEDFGKTDFALEALIASMDWDERVYGREYDLDVFNIVAVSDFNMGAMENKGLNIFNTSAVLASPQTATDANFERVEGIIAHEYFHNWTGNRITCRDWFQLCLKEGLTVFRDQSFTGDLRGHAVKRINDVITLRARQFREDAGPLSHNVRPESFVEINNFYTATVYEKGAEIIGMLKTLVGDEAYAKALDLYFERHDGHAATIEDWLKVFEDTTGRDLSQFKLWYAQAGTPVLVLQEAWEDGTLTLTFTQHTPPTPGQEQKHPLVIPIAVGLIGQNGAELRPTQVLEMTQSVQSFRFEGLTERPVASVLRGFSAPVILQRETTPELLSFLLAHDTDSFNRWEAGRELARLVLLGMVNKTAAPTQSYLQGLAATLADEALDPAFRALMLALPSEEDTAQSLAAAGIIPDPEAIHTAHEALKNEMADQLCDLLRQIYLAHQVQGPYSPAPEQAGKRALTNAALSLLTRRDEGALAEAQFEASDNMTQTLAALSSLLALGHGAFELEAFAKTWAEDKLVMDKWFMLQVVHAAPENLRTTVERLTALPSFDWKNPNRFRAVFSALSANPAGFHSKDGSVYRLLADWLIRLDSANPQTAARVSSAFDSWRRYDKSRQALMRAQLERIANTAGISRDLGEMVGRMLG